MRRCYVQAGTLLLIGLSVTVERSSKKPSSLVENYFIFWLISQSFHLISR